MAARKCGSCGSAKRSSTARISEPRISDSGGVPRVATSIPIRYVVNGKRFATLTAAQDYARTKPGAVIKQL